MSKMSREGTLRLMAFKRLCVLAPWSLVIDELRLREVDDCRRLDVVQRDPKWRKPFARIPMSIPGRPRGRAPNNPELTLYPALQDLADILAHEADGAFTAKYYPRMPAVNVSADHVKRVMTALQREVDGEAASRMKEPPRFSELPWERQCALAERRRYWYRCYGITPQNFWRQTWSLWRVAEMPFPEGIE